ncbi:glycosyltransferase family 4 protein [Geobacter sp.]|uniref:glycosyltransferase family 4 protein n=1 Tax=Geobacter sp. TaxID=46610 RepID=UPI0027B991F9|nr:glycosyltransferase [Geobacter sp.]
MRYIFLTNMPTPYRTAFYDELFRHGLNFEVYYMREREADRSWKVDTDCMKHPFRIDSGYYRMIGRYHLHFNPRLVIELLLRQSGVEIIIGGSWNDIDVLLLVLFKRLGILKTRLHFWSEANYLTIGSRDDNIVKKLLRSFVYNSSDGAQISSGKMTEITFEKWGFQGKRFIPLPNTIEEEKYRISEEEVELRYAEHDNPVFFMPMRLLENIKGIVNFFMAIGVDNIRKGVFILAGDGPDEDLVRGFIREHGVEGHIRLLGFCDSDKVASLYKRASVFLLPSFSDASPLTLVEALIMRLPVLVSERCGNHFEAVVEGANGFRFDPFDHGSIRSAFESMLAAKERWRSMGEKSAELYRSTFQREVVIENFISALTEFTAFGTGAKTSPTPSLPERRRA